MSKLFAVRSPDYYRDRGLFVTLVPSGKEVFIPIPKDASDFDYACCIACGKREASLVETQGASAENTRESNARNEAL